MGVSSPSSSSSRRRHPIRRCRVACKGLRQFQRRLNCSAAGQQEHGWAFERYASSARFQFRGPDRGVCARPSLGAPPKIGGTDPILLKAHGLVGASWAFSASRRANEWDFSAKEGILRAGERRFWRESQARWVRADSGRLAGRIDSSRASTSLCTHMPPTPAERFTGDGLGR